MAFKKGNTFGFKKGQVSFMKGKHPSLETIKKSSESHKGQVAWNKGKKLSPHTEEWKKKVSEKLKGRKFTESHRNNLSKGRIGMKFSEETKRRISLSKKGQNAGDKSYQWKGGISFEPYPICWNRTLKQSIRERDRYTCKICGKEGLEVHHIDYNKDNCNPINLITLCKSCHSKTTNHREEWIEYFNGGTQ